MEMEYLFRLLFLSSITFKQTRGLILNGIPITHLFGTGSGHYLIPGTNITASHNSPLTITDSTGGASVVLDDWQVGNNAANDLYRMAAA